MNTYLEGCMKWICQPEKIPTHLIDIHKVGGDLRVLMKQDTFLLNHYRVQSYLFYVIVKGNRGDAVTPDCDHSRNERSFNEINAKATVEDYDLKNMILKGSC